MFKPFLVVLVSGGFAIVSNVAAQTASTLVRAHAINEGSDREESLPSF